MANLKCRTTPWGSALVNCYCGVWIINLLEERNRGEEVCSLIIGVAIYKTCLSHSQLWNLFLCQREWSYRHLVPYTSQSYIIGVFFVGLPGNHKSLLIYYESTTTMSTEDRPLEKDFSNSRDAGNTHAEIWEDTLRRIQTAGSFVITPEIFEKMYLTPPNKVKGDLRLKFANPTPLEVFSEQTQPILL